MTDLAIETSDLTRYFGKHPAVRELELAVPRGSVTALIGRNGSGKTTTIRMLLGLLEPTRGMSRVFGHDSRSLGPAVRARIGYLTEGHYVPAWMTVREVGRFQAGSFPHWNASTFDAVIRHFQLAPDAHARDLSRGERAGLCLALTLAQQPELLVLDDPAIGLDPVSRRALLEAMLLVTRATDRTILFSSHQLSDVERVADRIAILDRGRLRVSCSISQLLERVARWVLRFAGGVPPVPSLPGLLQATHVGDELHVTVANHDADTDARLTSLCPLSVVRSPLGFEDAVLAYLDGRGPMTASLLAVGEMSA
jgi:ABC-2 type transport system ATP-binding protein